MGGFLALGAALAALVVVKGKSSTTAPAARAAGLKRKAMLQGATHAAPGRVGSNRPTTPGGDPFAAQKAAALVILNSGKGKGGKPRAPGNELDDIGARDAAEIGMCAAALANGTPPPPQANCGKWKDEALKKAKEWGGDAWEAIDDSDALEPWNW